MSHPASARPGERVFAAKSLWVIHVIGMLLVVPLVAVGLEMLLGTWIRSRWNLRPDLFLYAAWGTIGAGAFCLLAGAYSWWAELRWVSLADDGLRWWKNGSVHFRPWHDVAEVRHVSFQIRGSSDGPVFWVEVHFRSGWSHLHLSDSLVEDYESLIAAIKLGSPNRLLGQFTG
jgi:hypothetical protein